MISCLSRLFAICSCTVGALPANSYLCSGLDLYLTCEPDLMASMALVHSRIRRVFYRHSCPSFGALESGRGHIHCLRSLNHHFRVFKFNNDGSKANTNEGTYSTRPVTEDEIKSSAL